MRDSWRETALELLRDDQLTIRYFRDPKDRELDEEFRADPLGDTWLPHWRLQDMCDCDEAARHSFVCPASPIFTTSIAISGAGTGFWDPVPQWSDTGWICWSIDGQRHHTGGAINGFRHWCVLDSRMVGDE